MMQRDREAERRAFLVALYELADADTIPAIQVAELCRRVDLPESEATKVIRYLVDRGFIERRSDHAVGLHWYGVDAAERFLAEGMVVPMSVQVLSVEEQQAVEEFLTSYRQADEEDGLRLDRESKAVVDADIATLEAQLRSPRPRRRVVLIVVNELHEVLRNVASSGVVIGIGKLVQVLG